MSPRFVFKFLVALAAATTAQAQCPDFHPAPSGTAIPDIAGGLVYAAATYDPDGAGPLVPRIVIAGSFTSAGGSICNRIAQWDGTRWSQLGTGMEGDVLALAVHNGELYAGGNFGTAGGVVVNCIARWNGSIWRAITSSGIAGVDGPVFALAEVQGTLYVGGSFLHTGSLNASRIARLTTSWFPMSSGVNGSVNALVADGSRVIVGGTFTTAGGQGASNIAAFDGNFWSPLGAGVSSSVKALAKFNNRIYAGGTFATANGGATNVWGIARFNGTFWEAVGPNGTGIASTHVSPRVSSMHIYNNRLHIGGLFDFAGGVACNNIASFDGANFQPLGAGVGPASADVFAMTQFQGSLIAAGAFNTAGGAPSQAAAMWNGNQWSQLQSQPAGPVVCMTTCNGSLVAGGGFDFLTAPQVVAHNVVGYNEKGGVAPFQSPEGFTGTNGPVLAACAQTLNPVQPQSVVLAGDFGWANGIEVSNIVRLNQFGVPDSLGNGLNDTVRAVAMYQNMLYAAGDFTASGGVAMNGIARFSGGAWQNIGGMPAAPLAMAVYNGHLYLGGDFDSVGGLGTGGLARFDGTNWSVVGGYFFGAVYSLTVHQDKLIIAGSLPGFAGSINIVAWDGASYLPLATGLGSINDGHVNAVAVHNGALYAAGLFSIPGAAALADLARWDGVSWQPVDTTITGGSIYTLQSYNNQLWLGGSFTGFNGKFIPNIARLYCDCYANCDGSLSAPVLTPNDFQCFLNQYAAGNAYANCDGSAGTPALTPNDFQCYLNRFASGCP